MKVQENIKYIAEDSVEFEDKEECLVHELKLLIDKIPIEERISFVVESGGLKHVNISDVIDEDKTSIENVKSLDCILNESETIIIPNYESNRILLDVLRNWLGFYDEINSAGHWVYIGGKFRNINHIDKHIDRIKKCINGELNSSKDSYEIFETACYELQKILKDI